MWLWKVKKKKLKALIRFHCATKIDNYNSGGARGGGEEEEKNPKESTE